MDRLVHEVVRVEGKVGTLMGIVVSCFAKAGGTGISNDLFHTARAAYRTGALDAVICYGNRQ